MGSLGTGEILVIAVVALIVFGPKRLPELARKAGEMLAKTREATKSVTSALDSEYDGITAPLQDLKSEYDSTVKGLKDAASTATGFSVDMSSPRPAARSESDTPTGPDDASPDASTDTQSPPDDDASPDASTDTQSPPDDDTTPHDAVSDPETDS
jgi:Tat protein translocase TatB subunit